MNIATENKLSLSGGSPARLYIEVPRKELKAWFDLLPTTTNSDTQETIVDLTFTTESGLFTMSPMGWQDEEEASLVFHVHKLAPYREIGHLFVQDNKGGEGASFDADVGEVLFDLLPPGCNIVLEELDTGEVVVEEDQRYKLNFKDAEAMMIAPSMGLVDISDVYSPEELEELNREDDDLPYILLGENGQILVDTR